MLPHLSRLEDLLKFAQKLETLNAFTPSPTADCAHFLCLSCLAMGDYTGAAVHADNSLKLYSKHGAKLLGGELLAVCPRLKGAGRGGVGLVVGFVGLCESGT
jgi:hypothetical protein